MRKTDKQRISTLFKRLHAQILIAASNSAVAEEVDEIIDQVCKEGAEAERAIPAAYWEQYDAEV